MGHRLNGPPEQRRSCQRLSRPAVIRKLLTLVGIEITTNALASTMISEGRSMPNHRSDVDGARVLADLNALRAIGAYKTGVHKPTFSEPHMRSLQWLAQRLPQAGPAAQVGGTAHRLWLCAKRRPNSASA